MKKWDAGLIIQRYRNEDDRLTINRLDGHFTVGKRWEDIREDKRGD